MIDANDIDKIRKAKRMSWRQFAEHLGVNPSTVWRWREGEAISGSALVLLERLKQETADPWSLL